MPWTVGAGYDDILRVQRGHAPPFSVDSTSSYRDFSISRFDLEVCNSIFLGYGTRLSFEIASCVGRLFRVRDQFFKGAKLGLY